jgi:Pyruvate/2-oxoacid:ferredoxin oxidoreductase delta subunit/flavodoxin
MIVIYFSGTGNTKHLSELLASQLSCSVVSIEDPTVIEKTTQVDELIFAFPVYASNTPRIVKDFINNNPRLWLGKRIFIITTCGILNGAAIRNAGGLFQKYGAEILGGERFFMPDNIGDVSMITTILPQKRNPKVLKRADERLQNLAAHIKRGEYPQRGLSVKPKTNALDKDSFNFSPKIDKSKCTNCGICTKNCPSPQKCTLCYRCFNLCPNQAITIMGDKVRVQYLHEDFKR